MLLNGNEASILRTIVGWNVDGGKMTLRQNALAYSATTVAASLMNAVFQFYYVNMFLNVHQYVTALLSLEYF